MIRGLGGMIAVLAVCQAVVPVEREPMHAVVFENELVRVIDATVPAGAATQYHTHMRDNVPIVVAAGRIATTVLGGAPVRSDIALGSVSYARGGYTHEVRNIASAPVRFIDVELLGPRAPARTDISAAPADRGHRVEIDNRNVVVRRRLIGPGQTGDTHVHAGPLLEVVISGGPVAGGDLESRPGAFRWRADGRVPALQNRGEAGFEVVEVEWKP